MYQSSLIRGLPLVTLVAFGLAGIVGAIVLIYKKSHLVLMASTPRFRNRGPVRLSWLLRHADYMLFIAWAMMQVIVMLGSDLPTAKQLVSGDTVLLAIAMGTGMTGIRGLTVAIAARKTLWVRLANEEQDEINYELADLTQSIAASLLFLAITLVADVGAILTQ